MITDGILVLFVNYEINVIQEKLNFNLIIAIFILLQYFFFYLAHSVFFGISFLIVKNCS